MRRVISSLHTQRGGFAKPSQEQLRTKVELLDYQFTYTKQFLELKKPQRFLAKNLVENLVKKKSLRVWK